jgi:hypothetical protein
MLTQMYFAPDGALHTGNRPVSINIGANEVSTTCVSGWIDHSCNMSQG